MKKKGGGYRCYIFVCDWYSDLLFFKVKFCNIFLWKCRCLFKFNVYEKEFGVWNIKNYEDFKYCVYNYFFFIDFIIYL